MWGEYGYPRGVSFRLFPSHCTSLTRKSKTGSQGDCVPSVDTRLANAERDQKAWSYIKTGIRFLLFRSVSGDLYSPGLTSTRVCHAGDTSPVNDVEQVDPGDRLRGQAGCRHAQLAAALLSLLTLPPLPSSPSLSSSPSFSRNASFTYRSPVVKLWVLWSLRSITTEPI